MLWNRTTRDVAARFGVTERTVRNWCARGRLPAYKVGGIWRIAAVPSIPKAYSQEEQGGDEAQGGDKSQRGDKSQSDFA